MKISGICEAIGEFNRTGAVEEFNHVLVHTGAPDRLSDVYFNDLDLPQPNLFLGADEGSPSLQTARTMERFETVLLQEKPNAVLVIGGADSALACGLATKRTVCSDASTHGRFISKLGHVEAGSRSLDRRSPEEVNRVTIDAIADFLFTADRAANLHLAREGISEDKIHLVGSLRVDTLLRYRRKAEQSGILSDLHLVNATEIRPYAVLALRRSERAYNKALLCRMFGALLEITRQIPIVCPADPSMLKTIERGDLGEFFIDHTREGPEPWDSRVRMRLIPPLGYLDFLRLIAHARVIFTDSTGVQQESAVLGVPCIVVCEAMKRPMTLARGIGMPARPDPRNIVEQFRNIFRACTTSPQSGEACDGSAARRIVKILAEDHFAGRRQFSPPRDSRRVRRAAPFDSLEPKSPCYGRTLPERSE